MICYVCFISQQFLFDAATWLMAYNYCICSIKLQNVNKRQSEKDQAEEKRKDRCYEVINLTMLVSIFISAAVWATFRFMRNANWFYGISYDYAAEIFYSSLVISFL
jgi:hypothetical protein